MSMKSILIAVAPDDSHVVSAIVGTEFDVVVCHTLKDAQANLKEHIGLIACGVHFDHGNMFELLRAAKANQATRSVPFFLVLKENTSHSPAVVHGIRSAGELLGVDVFIDLSALSPDADIQVRYERVRQMAREALSISALSQEPDLQ
jgi:hypothetical protein